MPRTIEAHGRALTAREWAAETDASPITILARLRRGAPAAQAVASPHSEDARGVARGKIVAGDEFGWLTAVRPVPRAERPAGHEATKARWECRCRCGRIVEVRAGALRDHATRSCGCRRTRTGRRLAVATAAPPADERSALAPAAQHVLVAALDADLMARLAERAR